ncbi:MFS transporter [Streptomyces sp. NPDC051561]|uniref:MFS transporter n=1 Tax=Streptomyces sp. NPDC051561 TaxID=3365658 RepID=UPI0037AE7DF3
MSARPSPSATPPSVAPPSYGAVLRTPHASRTFAAALLGRLSYGVLPLPLVLAVKNATGSYAAAGIVTAVFGACSVLLSPFRAGLVDRYGPRRALLPMSFLYAALLTVLALTCREPGAPVPLIGALAGLAGCCCPPLGPTMRMLWGRLMPNREMLQRAYSLDGVAEELLFVTGPLLIGIPLVYEFPVIGVLIAAGLVVVGPVVMVASPLAARAEAGARGKEGGGKRGARVRMPGLGLPVAVAAGVGLALGGIELLAVAFTEEQGRPEFVGWTQAALSVGSAVGGLAYGAVGWRSGARTRLPVIALGLGCALALAGFSPGVYVFAAAAALAGLFIAPAITTSYLLADEAAGAGSRTRAGAWVNTSLNAGSSVGTAVVGLVVGRLPLALCFVLAAVPVLCSAGAGLFLRGGQSSEPESGRESEPAPEAEPAVVRSSSPGPSSSEF